jgi:flagellar biosynthesis protein FliR
LEVVDVPFQGRVRTLAEDMIQVKLLTLAGRSLAATAIVTVELDNDGPGDRFFPLLVLELLIGLLLDVLLRLVLETIRAVGSLAACPAGVAHLSSQQLRVFMTSHPVSF